MADPEDRGVRQLQAVRSTLDYLARLDEPGAVRFMTRWTTGLAPAGSQSKWRDKALLKRQKELIASFRDDLRAIQSEIADRLAEDWLSVLREDFLPFWRRERFAAGALVFDDLLHETRRLLAEDPKVRRTLVGRYRHLLVDEFQDTDPVQAEILVRLAADPDDPDWRTAAIPGGRLFVVGDMKQSIYRFRGADVETFQAMTERLKDDGGRVLRIEVTFRAAGEVVEAVNRRFRELMPAEPDPDRPYVSPFVPLVAARREEPRTRVMARAEAVFGPVLERRRAEAAATAGVIRHAVERAWPIRDRATGAVRPVTYGDIAVLMPNRTGQEWFRAAFAAAGIPVLSLGGVDFFRQDEVRGLTALFKTLLDPDDEASRLAFLLSPWVGLSHAALAGDRPGESAPASGFLGAPELRRVDAALGTWRERLDDWRPVDFFDAAIASFGLRDALFAIGDRQALANLDKLRHLTRRLGGEWGLAGLAAWLAERVATGAYEAEAPVVDEGSAVEISTVHQAKGLEWPMVVVTNWHEEPVRLDGLLRSADGARAGYKGTWIETAGHASLAAEAKARAEAERTRLLYVALTRARDYLILVEAWDPKRGPLLSADPEIFADGGFGEGAPARPVATGRARRAVPPPPPPGPPGKSPPWWEATDAFRVALDRYLRGGEIPPGPAGTWVTRLDPRRLAVGERFTSISLRVDLVIATGAGLEAVFLIPGADEAAEREAWVRYFQAGDAVSWRREGIVRRGLLSLTRGGYIPLD